MSILRNCDFKNNLQYKQELFQGDIWLGSAIKNMGLFSKIPIDFKIETRDL